MEWIFDDSPLPDPHGYGERAAKIYQRTPPSKIQHCHGNAISTPKTEIDKIKRRLKEAESLAERE
ncbi:hypothetical protein [Bradyrhizobium sp. 170]|uniref:hypothetical protein n=1 Tax=Bradyrhizobium sp. 170 TaxID=2782641 RepID=UPI001FFE4304|nr:hypothetical protein [Bradyrhizobium sp. 170]UPK03725.1 hypothetical protein IVB05_40630 [Bradyrhizobium sp. 170]